MKDLNEKPCACLRTLQYVTEKLTTLLKKQRGVSTLDGVSLTVLQGLSARWNILLFADFEVVADYLVTSIHTDIICFVYLSIVHLNNL